MEYKIVLETGGT